MDDFDKIILDTNVILLGIRLNACEAQLILLRQKIKYVDGLSEKEKRQRYPQFEKQDIEKLKDKAIEHEKNILKLRNDKTQIEEEIINYLVV